MVLFGRGFTRNFIGYCRAVLSVSQRAWRARTRRQQFGPGPLGSFGSFPEAGALTIRAPTAPPQHLLLHHSTGITGPCVPIDDLKHLTIYENTWHDRLSALLSMLHYGAKLEHVVVNTYSSFNHRMSDLSSYNPVWNIQQAVLAWRFCDSDLRANVLLPAAGVVDEKGTSTRLFRDTHGLERLDIYIYNGTPNGSCLHAEFQHDCQDLVALRARLEESDPRAIIPTIASIRFPLRRVEVVCMSIHKDMYRSPFEALCYLLGSLPELEHLEFETRSGLSKEESIAIFQGKFPGYPSGSTTTTDTTSTTTTEWMCQRLERLAIRGLWRAYPQDHPDKKNVDIVLRAASDKHQWVARGVVEFGNKLKEAISGRLRTLPALTELTLGTMMSPYRESRSIANFEYLVIDAVGDIKNS